MAVEANSDGEYDYLEAAAREEQQAAAAAAGAEVISIDDDDEEARRREMMEEEEEEEEEEYDYEAAVSREREDQRRAARLAGHEDDDLSVGSNYEYEMSDGEAEGNTQGKDLADADSEAFVEATDGMFAKVEAPSSHLIRLWICVTPRRLYEGLGSKAVDALGLDRNKGIMAMLTTDQYYTLSSKCPEVKWLRQVHPDKMNRDSLRSDGSVGETFPLQWMLRKRLEEELSQNWPPKSRYSDDEDDDDDDGTNFNGGGARGGGAVTEDKHNSEATRSAIEAICECTGVSPELASYALQFSHFDEQLAQNNLLDEGTRLSLEMTLADDREAAIAELKKTFPYVDEVVLLHAVAAHPGAPHLQRNYVCRVETGEQQLPTPTPPSPPSSQADAPGSAEAAGAGAAGAGAAGGAVGGAAAAAHQQQQLQQQQPSAAADGGGSSGGSGGVTGRLRRWGTKKRSPPGSSPSKGRGKGKGKGKRRQSSPETRAAENSQGAGVSGSGDAHGKGSSSRGWEGTGDLEFMPVDLTEDEEREDRRNLLEHLADKNLLLRVAHTIITKLRNANKRCLVCDDKIQGFLPAVPIVCSKELCVMSSEDMGCGTDVESQLVKKGETVDLLIDLFWMAMEGGGSRTDLAFPEAVQCGSGQAFKTRSGRNDAGKVKEVLALLPSVADMQRCIERKKNNRGGGISEGKSRAEVEEAGGVWNPGPLRGQELIKEIPCEKQFMLVTGTAEKEMRFQTMKRMAAARTGGTGSFYAFHGSRPYNWHGILHMGLRNMSGTKYQSAGAAYGSGIYMADELQVSLGYAGVGAPGAGSSHWPMSTFGSSQAVIVAVCEVIDKEENRKTHGPRYFVIPEEECVATRYLLINPDTKAGKTALISASKLTIRSQR
eukprot:g11138.t1